MAGVYAFDLPGTPEDRISIEFEDGMLTVSAERERTKHTEDDPFYRYERRLGSFTRTLGLPQGVKSGGISASTSSRSTSPSRKRSSRNASRSASPQTIEGTAGKSE